ncbi:MAG: hypothetical protein ABJB97_03855 [Acidobacteriota bacterium]
MRQKTIFIATVFIFTLITSAMAYGQTQTPAQKVGAERAVSLHQQLADVEAQQRTLQTRLQQLEEDSKPENIEKSLAGVGSTKPEELREQRRRQLETEKNNVQLQLTKLATSKSRLETGVAQADADVYHASAGVNADGTPAAPARESKDLNISPGVKNQIENPATVKRRSRRTRRVRSKARRSPTHHALG